MLSQGLPYSTQLQTGADALTVHVAGRMMLRHVLSARESWAPIMNAIQSTDAPKIVFDLSGCQQVDSAGLGVFIVARDTARAGGRPIVLKNANENILRVFKLACFDRLFVLENDAVAA